MTPWSLELGKLLPPQLTLAHCAPKQVLVFAEPWFPRLQCGGSDGVKKTQGEGVHAELPTTSTKTRVCDF